MPDDPIHSRFVARINHVIGELQTEKVPAAEIAALLLGCAVEAGIQASGARRIAEELYLVALKVAREAGLDAPQGPPN